MTDEIIAPLMDDNNNTQEENEILTENINNNDNENQALLNNNKIIREPIINNKELTNQQKSCIILLSFIIQLILFFLSIYYLSDYINNLNPIIINIIFFISMIIIFSLTLIHLSNIKLLIRLSISIKIIIVTISTVSMFFILYKLSVFWTFHVFALIIFAIIISELSLLIVNFFNIDPHPDLLIQEQFWALVIINTYFCIIIFFLEREKLDIADIINIGGGGFIFGTLSMAHLDFLMKKRIFNYLIIHLSLYMEIVIAIVNYFIVYLAYKYNEKKEEYRKKKKFMK